MDAMSSARVFGLPNEPDLLNKGIPEYCPPSMVDCGTPVQTVPNVRSARAFTALQISNVVDPPTVNSPPGRGHSETSRRMLASMNLRAALRSGILPAAL